MTDVFLPCKVCDLIFYYFSNVIKVSPKIWHSSFLNQHIKQELEKQQTQQKQIICQHTHLKCFLVQTRFHRRLPSYIKVPLQL